MSPALASTIAGRFESAVGSEHVRTNPSALSAYQVDGIVPAVAVLPEDEDAGAGRFYQRLGWQVFVRQRKGWQWVESQIAGAPDTV